MNEVIKLDNVSKSFGEHVIFNAFSLDIYDGEYVVITGDSGRGKTTLLNIIGMLERPDSGNVFITGIKNPRFDSKKGREILRNSMTYIFQNYGLIDDATVGYNLKIKGHLKGKDKLKDMVAALYNTGLDETFVNKKIFELSGGEQQRVSLSGLFLRDYKIVLADEPTGSLDDTNKEKVLNIFDEIHKDGKTIIVVTHDHDVADRAERIIRL